MKVLTHAVILDDHRLFADSFSLLLKKECDIDLIQSFDASKDFFSFLRTFGRNKIYVFLDYYFPNENGLSLLTEIRRINELAKVIVVTGAIAPSVIKSILQYRPDGMLSKACQIHHVMDCITAINQGQNYIFPEFKQMKPVDMKNTQIFTARELEMLKYFSQGHSVAETASLTFLSPHTVVAHRRKMMAKTNCQTITQMLRYALDHELI